MKITISGRPKSTPFAEPPPPLGGDEARSLDRRTNQRRAFSEVVKARNDAGDANAHFLDVAEAKESEKTACEFHPNLALHARTGKAVAEAVKKATGW